MHEGEASSFLQLRRDNFQKYLLCSRRLPLNEIPLYSITMIQFYQIIKKNDISIVESHYEPKPKMIIECRNSIVEFVTKTIIANMHGYSLDEVDEGFESQLVKIEHIE